MRTLLEDPRQKTCILLPGMRFLKYERVLNNFFIRHTISFVCVCVCVFTCSGCCSDRNGSLVEMGGEDLSGVLVKKKKTIHINVTLFVKAYTSKGYGLID